MPSENEPHRFSGAIRDLKPALKSLELVDVIALIVLTLPIFDGFSGLLEKNFSTFPAWFKFITYTLLAVLSIGVVIVQKRNAINYVGGKAEGSVETLKRWDRSAGLLETALNSTARYFNKRLNTRERAVTAAEESIDRILIGVEDIFSVLFISTCGTLHVSLGIPNNSGDQFKIAKMQPETGGRSSENVYPVDRSSSDLHTMSLAFQVPESSGLLYEPNSRDVPGLEDKSYQSIVNITIYGPQLTTENLFIPQPTNTHRVPIAVLNIDSTNSDAFGDEERLRLAYRLCMPHLRMLALILSDKRVFGEYRFSEGEA